MQSLEVRMYPACLRNCKQIKYNWNGVSKVGEVGADEVLKVLGPHWWDPEGHCRGTGFYTETGAIGQVWSSECMSDMI